MSTKRDRQYYRELGRRGGQATVRKYGSSWMSSIGRLGWRATTTKYFRNERDHKEWLTVLGKHNYWKSTGLPMKRTIDGTPLWPPEPPVHPSRSNYVEF